MDITIDIDSLRNDLVDYFGTAKAKEYYPAATIDLVKLERASDEEIVRTAINNGFNLYDYEIKNKSR